MKKYKFDLKKYYTDEEMNAVRTTLANFCAYKAQDGVAAYHIDDTIYFTVSINENDVIHLVINNDEYNELPKILTKPRQIADIFIKRMNDAVKQTEADNAYKAQKLEDSLISRLGCDINVDTPTDVASATNANANTNNTSEKFTVVKNGVEITDPDEKQKVIEDIEQMRKDLNDKMNKLKAFKNYLGF